MATPLRALLLEDRLEDAAMLLFELRRAGFDPHPVRVSSEVDYLAALDDEFDIVIANYEMGSFDGLAALDLLQSRQLDLPFILISATSDEELAVESVRKGAADYLAKDRLERLGRAVARALDERQMRAEKRRGEAFLRLQERALTATANGVLICDAGQPDLPIIFCNRGFEQMTGYRIADVLGRNCRFLQGPETDPRTAEIIRQALAEEREVRVVIRNYRKDGSAFWNELAISPVRDGHVTHFIGISSDVSARKETEERLLRGERLLAQGQSVAHLGSFDWDIPTEQITWSEELYRIFGIEPGTRVSLAMIRRFLPPEDQPKMNGLIAPGPASDSIEFDHRILRPGGETRIVQLLAKRITNATGKVVRVSGTIQDITASRAAQAALRDSEARFRAIMDSAIDAVIIADEQLRITGFNPAAVTMFGRTHGEALGKPLRETILPKKDVAGNSGGFLRFLQSRENSDQGHRFEITAAHADGREFPAEITVTSASVDGRGAVTTYIRDLSAERAASALAAAKTDETLRQQSALLALASRQPSEYFASLQEILKCDAETLAVERVSFWNLRADATRLECQSLYLRTEGRLSDDPSGRPEMECPGCTDLLRLTEVLIVESALTDEKMSPFIEHIRALKIGAVLCVPVWAGAVVVGAVLHEHVGSDRIWSPEDLNFATSIASLVSLALAQRRRHEAEQALRESEERFRATFEQAAVGIGHLSLEGRWLWLNQRLCEIFGCSRGDLLSGGKGGTLHPEHPEPLAKGLQGLLKSEIDNFTSDQAFVRHDGSTVWVNITVGLKRSAAGEPLYFIAVLQDITDRKRAEERVLEQASLLDLTHDAIIVRDLEDRIVFWNHGAERLYGISGLEAIGLRESELLYIHSEDFEYGQGEVLEKGEWYGELRQRSRGQESEITVDARWTLVYGDDGEPRSILAINTDISGRKSLEDQFLRAQRMESIGTLASGVAHDLNNILAPILMAIPMLRGELPEKIRDSILDSMETSAQRGADIVRQVLTFARGVEGERVLLQPSHLLREMDKIAAETFPKTLAIRSDIPGDLWTVTGDATQLHQVLMNLCVNARDAMPDGGTLTVAAENFELDESSAAMTPGGRVGPYVMLQVSDTGIGIPRETLAKIFDPFFTTKELGKGTGLGLSTVMGIVKSHGGFLKVASEVGRGTTFRVYVPATVESRLMEREIQPMRLQRGNGELLLVVDDEASIRQVTAAILRKHGYEVLLACDGTDALATYAQRNGTVEAVLTDVVMPYIDGVALTRALKKLNPDVKIIASTGQGENARMGELHSLGVESFLSKPYTTEKLLRAIHELLAPDSDQPHKTTQIVGNVTNGVADLQVI